MKRFQIVLEGAPDGMSEWLGSGPCKEGMLLLLALVVVHILSKEPESVQRFRY